MAGRNLRNRVREDAPFDPESLGEKLAPWRGPIAWTLMALIPILYVFVFPAIVIYYEVGTAAAWWDNRLIDSAVQPLEFLAETVPAYEFYIEWLYSKIEGEAMITPITPP